MKRLITIIGILVVFLLAGCHVIAEGQTISTSRSAAPKIVGGVSTMNGAILNAQNQPIQSAAVHFAQVYRDKGSAAFLFDASNSPSVVSGPDGSFSISNLDAGEYVIVVGDPMSDYAIVSEADGTPKVVVAQGGGTIDLGLLSVNY
jgi:hypothetical protein